MENTTVPAEAARRYVLHARQYLENGLVALQLGEAGKADELFWGSVAEALHAVAVLAGRPITTHRDLKNFALQLARDLKDEAIENNFLIAESLHKNFYLVEDEPEDIAVVVPVVQALVTRLFEQIPREAI